MFKAVLSTAFFAATALAIPGPNAPTPGDIVKTGSDCTVGWTADPTGKWTTMNIELMAGPNLNMQHLTTVATVDGTDATKTTFTFTCPGVTPNSAIFFYQFSSPAEPTNITWTGRFAIADANGNTTPPPNATQPTSNDPIPWGNAQLLDPSTAQPAPPYLGGGANVVLSLAAPNGTSTGVPSTTASVAGTSATAASVPSGSGSGSTSAGPGPNAPSADSAASNSNSTTGANNASGAASLDMGKRGAQAMAALAGTALVFLTVF